MAHILSTSPLWPLYTKVRPLVHSLRAKYGHQFWLIGDWDRLGYRLLARLCHYQPEVLQDTCTLRLTYLVALIKYLDLVRKNQDNYDSPEAQVHYLVLPPAKGPKNFPQKLE